MTAGKPTTFVIPAEAGIQWRINRLVFWMPDRVRHDVMKKVHINNYDTVSFAGMTNK